jgi:hypothetical protein
MNIDYGKTRSVPLATNMINNNTLYIAIERREDGYVLLLWREGVVVSITLDHEFNVTGWRISHEV